MILDALKMLRKFTGDTGYIGSTLSGSTLREFRSAHSIDQQISYGLLPPRGRRDFPQPVTNLTGCNGARVHPSQFIRVKWNLCVRMIESSLRVRNEAINLLLTQALPKLLNLPRNVNYLIIRYAFGGKTEHGFDTVGWSRVRSKYLGIKHPALDSIIYETSSLERTLVGQRPPDLVTEYRAYRGASSSVA